MRETLAQGDFRRCIYKRWAIEGHAGLDDKPPVPHEPACKVTFQAIQEVRRLARSLDPDA